MTIDGGEGVDSAKRTPELWVANDDDKTCNDDVYRSWLDSAQAWVRAFIIVRGCGERMGWMPHAVQCLRLVV